MCRQDPLARAWQRGGRGTARDGQSVRVRLRGKYEIAYVDSAWLELDHVPWLSTVDCALKVAIGWNRDRRRLCGSSCSDTDDEDGRSGKLVSHGVPRRRGRKDDLSPGRRELICDVAEEEQTRAGLWIDRAGERDRDRPATFEIDRRFLAVGRRVALGRASDLSAERERSRQHHLRAGVGRNLDRFTFDREVPLIKGVSLSFGRNPPTHTDPITHQTRPALFRI